MILRLAIVLALAGCTDGPTNGNCGATCGTCGNGEVCFGGDGFFPARCAKSCRTDDDCSGQKCLAVSGEKGPACLPADIAPCVGYAPNCSQSRTRCIDANTLSQLLSQSSCAFEQMTCANGCTLDHCN